MGSFARSLAVLAAFCFAAPAFALDDDFAATSWDTSVWRTRTPLPGSAVTTGAPAAAARDGREAQLTYPRDRPASEWGPRYASQIMSVQARLYGDYQARLSSGRAGTGEGVISAFFTYFNDGGDWDGDGIVDNHEIDIELPNSDRSAIFLSVYTDYQYSGNTETFHRNGARVNLATGEVWATAPGGEGGWDLLPAPPLPFSVPGFDHTARLYTYGFEWREDRVTFWIDLEDGAGRRQLWEVRGSALDHIPSLPTPTFFNTWHNPVDWWSRANAPPPSVDAVMHVDYVTVTDPGAGCTTDAECDDGNPCNGFEACDAGSCVVDVPIDCSDAAGACTIDSCSAVDPSTWECVNTPVSCNDGNACTVDWCDPVTGCGSTPVVCPAGQVCSGGACIPAPVCLGNNQDCSSNSECCSGRCRGGKRGRCLGN